MFDRRCGSVVMKVMQYLQHQLLLIVRHGVRLQVAQATSAAMRGRIACMDTSATELVACDESGHVATLSLSDAALLHQSVGGEAHANITR